ncbi:unnamed protein product [Didymodactylos carnosus]|uniref:NAD(P)(+)--arginine ADP-ribosyltransferase n=1 Tax=Didymodactylos carnosus TaxID=1234261 RepID=A0A815AZ36_9BILA|nr:unnamed protein product [Didymodactylos carnosus]CAF4043848.1 unnamed protein product [Didymodactylos carnosus]
MNVFFLSDYFGTTHVWWGVSSCTDMVHVTGDFLVNQTKKRTLFNIKCYDGKIIKNHSAYPNESETILPPGAYLKVKSSLDFTENLCIVDIEQIPPAPEEVAHSAGDADTPGTLSYSNSSQISDVHILWLDPNVNKSQENVKTQEKLKELYPSYYKSFEKYDELEKFIEQKQSCGVVLVTGGQIGSQIVPKIHDLLQSISLIVYCMDKEKNEKWSRNYTKVKAVVNRSDDMIKQVKKEYAQLVEEQKQQQQVTESKSSRFSDFQQEAAKLLTPLTGYQNQPLVSLEESLAPVMDIISDLPKYIWKAKYNCTPPADGLTPDESASIRIYSMEFNAPEGSLYSLLNQDLRSASRHAIKKWFLYLKLFFHALFKLPSIEGTVWRALPGNASIDYEIGKQFIWWGVSSTARNMSILNGYINSKHGQNTLFCIQCKNGKSIRNHSYFTEVDEILLMPGTNLEVMGQLEPAEGLRIINLKELDRPLFFQ